MSAWGYKVKHSEMRKHHSQYGPGNADLYISITIPYINTWSCIILLLCPEIEPNSHRRRICWAYWEILICLLQQNGSFNRTAGWNEELDLPIPSAIDFMCCWTWTPQNSLFPELLFYWEGDKQQSPVPNLLKCWVLTAATKITSTYDFSRETKKII